jgi:hypothetical protein
MYTEAIETKLQNVSTTNLMKMLYELDGQIAEARKIAQATDDFRDVQAMNTVRTAVINVLDMHDESLFDNYCAAKHA